VAAIVVIAVGLPVYGWVDVNYLQPSRPAVTVNGDAISYRELAGRLRMAQASLLNQRLQVEQMLSFFADTLETRAAVQQQIDQINTQLNDTGGLSRQILGTLIDGRLIRQEAQRRGIVVTQEDIDQAIAQTFGFFPEGTPTSAPTPTFDATLAAQATSTSTPAPTSTSTSGPSPTVRPSATPTSEPTEGPTATASASPTAYTRELFDADYQTYLSDIRTNLNVTEGVIRGQFEDDVYRERLRSDVEAGMSRDEEQVWAKHILVEQEAVAFALLSRYQSGESWDALAAQYSNDTANKDLGGDLGWFGRGAMVDAFGEAAFSTPVGQVAGPVQTGFGWHLILVLGHETRRLDPTAYQAAIDRDFSLLVESLRDAAEIVFDEPLRTPTPTASLSPTPATTETPVPPV
jgi:parvulin-like peptidyl-prolyl isomerase